MRVQTLPLSLTRNGFCFSKRSIAPSQRNAQFSSTSSASLQRTALYGLHLELGAKFTEFSGHSLPLQYQGLGIVASCLHTRTGASLFDTSHMGQVRIYGKDREAFLEELTVGDIKGMEPMDSKLTLLTNENGGIIDDSIVTVHNDFIQMVLNAGCKAKDLRHMTSHLEMNKERFPEVRIEELTDHSLLALQGPSSMAVLQELMPSVNLKRIAFMKGGCFDVADIPCAVTRCGYTGEDGFEISVPNSRAEDLARRLLSVEPVKPAGLGARDALRLEAGLCLYGHDINESISPVEANLVWTIGKRRLVEGGFLGYDVINEQIKTGVARKRIGFKGSGSTAREGTEIVDLGENHEEVPVGIVSSGLRSPSLKVPIGMGYVETSKSKSGTKLHTRMRGALHDIEVCKLPFVPASYYRG